MVKKGKEIDPALERLILDIITPLNPREPYYSIIRRELKRQGHWKDKPRGKPGFKRKEEI